MHKMEVQQDSELGKDPSQRERSKQGVSNKQESKSNRQADSNDQVNMRVLERVDDRSIMFVGAGLHQKHAVQGGLGNTAQGNETIVTLCHCTNGRFF